MKPVIFDRQYNDRPLWVLFFILIGVAVIALFSAGSTLAYKHDSLLGPVAQQTLFLLAGVVVAYLVQYLPTWSIRLGGVLILALSVLCLYIMIIPGNPFSVELNGAVRWFNFFGIRFQPSELAKLGLIIVVSDMLTRRGTDEEKKKRFFWSLGLTVVTCLPIFMNNLSTALLLAFIVLLMWILSCQPPKYILSVIGTVLVVLVVGYSVIEFGYVRPHRSLGGPFKRAVTQVKRVDALIEEMKQPKGEFRLNDQNYQRSIAKVAVMRGGKTPFGVFPGNSQERDFLPLAYADYIFAIIVEETGVVGAFFLMLLYLSILGRACYVSSRYEDYAAMLMMMGLALMLTCQALVSMAVAVGLGPVTGQPLPLVSRGGTSAIVTALYFGIMMCVAREQNMLKARRDASVEDNLRHIPEIRLDEDTKKNTNNLPEIQL